MISVDRRYFSAGTEYKWVLSIERAAPNGRHECRQLKKQQQELKRKSGWQTASSTTRSLDGINWARCAQKWRNNLKVLSIYETVENAKWLELLIATNQSINQSNDQILHCGNEHDLDDKS